jgi:hypothetical protein
MAAARKFAVPQPTISKIINGDVRKLSIEFLVRLLVRIGIPVAMQTGTNAGHAIAYVSAGESIKTEDELARGMPVQGDVDQQLWALLLSQPALQLPSNFAGSSSFEPSGEASATAIH